MHSNIRILTQAYKFSAVKHKKQRRKGIQDIPYINHPIEVANILATNLDNDDYILLIAAILHDTIEDTETTYDELKLNFGEEVANIVKEVSDNMLLSKEERKRLQIEKSSTLSDKAKMIKIADKICNVQDILQTRFHFTSKQKLKYISWSNEVVKNCRGVNEKLDKEFDNVLNLAHKAIGWTNQIDWE